jgi:hypothetical protein
MKDLKETVSLMTSEDYKERFMAEYYQLETRYLRLRKMYEKWDELPFKPTCPKSWYEKQLDVMFQYLMVLISRSVEEDIKLDCDETLTAIIREGSEGV